MSDQLLIPELNPQREVHYNLPSAALIEQAVARGEGVLAGSGALVARTFERTGRSPKDKFLVRDWKTEDHVWWDNNAAASRASFDRLWAKAAKYLSEKELFVTDATACADPANRIGVRLVTEFAWHALFARQLFRRPELEDRVVDQWTILGAPTLEADVGSDSTNSAAFISIDFSNSRVLIIGTQYAGEIKKSIFTVLNYLLPGRGVLPMHCSANVGEKGDVALFFGLSGTGKTTLSADPERRLIGDDEHGWSDNGVFNFEGGCYAKCIRLSAENEPEIWNAIRFGSVVENVVVDPATRAVDYNDATFTENTRVAYPLEFIPGALPEGMAGHAKTIVFLAADAFGVLPPVARLTPEQASYHFLSGFTSKLAGTEAGMGAEPEVTFSTCFGAPFLPLHPNVYAQMLADKIAKHDAKVFLVNTGWSGGGFGEGERIDLPSTRRIISAAVSGELDRAEMRRDPIFGFDVPVDIEGVDSAILNPRETWKDPAAYDAKAKELATRFEENFSKFADEVPKAVREAGPTL
ncbi:MAG TPA: phosphoenolpyruvate carboxykinase (ATP) [Actinomycetota bacterium]|nr:phosphoenolpyruvate carboxykinase (ATP) [Actinomycetota bacterium]